MVETVHLQPPDTGFQSDPLLFGVAEALARLFPIEELRLFLTPEPRAALMPSGTAEPAAAE